jgi:hypothetical protein
LLILKKLVRFSGTLRMLSATGLLIAVAFLHAVHKCEAAPHGQDGTRGRSKVFTQGVYRVKQEAAMNSDNQARLRVAALIYLMVNAVVFGVGMISVLMTPALVQHAFFWIPAIIVTSFVLSAPLAWFIAPFMMMRFIAARRVH